MFYVFDLLKNRCNCISMKNRRKRGKKRSFFGVGRVCVRWRWAASQLTRKKCVKFLVGGWLRWERERKSQSGVVRREIDGGFQKIWGGAGHVFAVFQYETDTCFCMCNAETRASYALKSGGNLGEGVFWTWSKEKMGEGDVFVCVVVSLLSCFFAVVFIPPPPSV